MNILGIDYGTKRIGLAWVQDGLDVVLPFGIVEHNEETVRKLADIISTERIDEAIIGLPVGLDGKENDNTARVREFAESLKSAIHCPVIFVDERFTSRQADNTPGDVSRDEKAAMIIVQDYLDRNKRGRDD